MKKVSLIICLFLLAGCAGSSGYMQKVDSPNSHTPPAGKSMLVFVRTSGMGWAIDFTVIDEKGDLVGVVPAKGNVKHVTEPGKQRYLVWAENIEALDADLAPDKTYYVKLPVNMGWVAARTDMWPIKQGSDDWEDVANWVDASTEWARDEELAAKWMTKKGEASRGYGARFDDYWDEYSEKEKEERTLKPADGR